MGVGVIDNTYIDRWPPKSSNSNSNYYKNNVKEENNYGSNWELTNYEICKYFSKFSCDLAKKRKSYENKVISKTVNLVSKSV